MLGTYHLTALFDILNKIHFVYEPMELWKFILEQACKTLQAEAGTFYEVSENQQQLKVAAVFGMEESRLSGVPFKMGVGISGWVAQYHQPALVNDVSQDNRFNRDVDLKTGFNTKSMLCIPVFSQKRTYGVLQIMNRTEGPFSPQDQEFMTLLGRQAAIAYQNLMLLREVSHTKILMESLVENLSGGLIAMDASGVLTILNPSSAQLLMLASKLGAGHPMQEVLKEYPWFIETLQNTLTTGKTVSRQETMVPIHGKPQRLGYSTILISDHEKNVLGAGILFQRLSSS